jgi:helicase
MWNLASQIVTRPDPDNPVWFPPQRDLLRKGFYDDRGHWLVCMPTGSGKTLAGEWALGSAMAGGFIGVYIAPLKAIVEERLADWERRFPDLSIGLFTGDRFGGKATGSPADHQLLLLTPEKLASYLQNWKSHLSWISRIGTLVVDEFHLIGDSGRGAGLECLLSRLRRINPFARIVGLSGTLANAESIASWLGAELFRSEWRPIPVEHRIVRFAKPTDKQELLLHELQETITSGGRALVFTNSRRRSEQLAIFLEASGLRVAFTHAGLDPAKRQAAQSRLRDGTIDVLTTTSSLEMGVNFPARKVVIYDSYGFDGESFGPLPVARYLQAAGRAGRAGLDPRGESVLFLPKWAGTDPDYAARVPEPVSSGLFRRKRLTQQLLVEVTGRLSISEEHLSTNFWKRSLWQSQGGAADLPQLIGELIQIGLLRRDAKTGKYLSETALGRIACQMVVDPATISLLRWFFEAVPYPTEFDVIIAVCLAEECTPRLGFNFEEIDGMADTLTSVPSHLLDAPVSFFQDLRGQAHYRTLLSAIKSAVIIHRHTSGESLEDLAEEFDAYPYDLSLLRQNAGWMLAVAQRVFSCLWKAKENEFAELEGEPADESAEQPVSKSPHHRLCEALSVMVEYGVPRDAVNLVKIPGIGRKRVQSLLSGGIRSLSEFFSYPEAALAHCLGVKPDTLSGMRDAAKKLQALEDIEDPFALEFNPAAAPSAPALLERWPREIDPYRLRRALELIVDHCSAEAVRVSGGAEPHRVTVARDDRRKNQYTCDCADFAKGHTQCKHVLRARLELKDSNDLLPLLRDLTGTDSSTRPLRYSLGELWMSVGSLYDRYADRQVDYSGQKFLRQALLTNPR